MTLLCQSPMVLENMDVLAEFLYSVMVNGHKSLATLTGPLNVLENVEVCFLLGFFVQFMLAWLSLVKLCEKSTNPSSNRPSEGDIEQEIVEILSVGFNDTCM